MLVKKQLMKTCKLKSDLMGQDLHYLALHAESMEHYRGLNYCIKIYSAIPLS